MGKLEGASDRDLLTVNKCKESTLSWLAYKESDQIGFSGLLE